MKGEETVNLRNYFIIGGLIFLNGLFVLHAGYNHPFVEKPPVLQQGQDHSMHHSGDTKQ